jgi:uncharacterized protein YkwD
LAPRLRLNAAPLALETLEGGLLGLVNTEREVAGLPILEFDPDTHELARVRAVSQLEAPRLTHFDGLGRLAFIDLLSQQGQEFRLAGENLARGPAGDPEVVDRIHVALMNSPTHRRNILEPSFNRLAIGAALDERGTLTFAQIFRAAY